MANDGDAFRIDLLFIRQVTQRATQTPGPGADRAPFIGCGGCLPVLVEERVNPVLEAIVEVRINITVVDSSQRIAALQNRLDRPATAFNAAGRLCSAMIDNAELFVVSHPGATVGNLGIEVNGLVAVEIESQKRWTRFLAGIRNVQKKFHQGITQSLSQRDRHLFSGRNAVQGVWVYFVDVKLQLG